MLKMESWGEMKGENMAEKKRNKDWEEYVDNFDYLPKEVIEGLVLAVELMKRRQAAQEAKTATIH